MLPKVSTIISIILEMSRIVLRGRIFKAVGAFDGGVLE